MNNKLKLSKTIFTTIVAMLTLASSLQARDLNDQSSNSSKEDVFWIEGSDKEAPVDFKIPSFAPILDKLSPSVVSISSKRKPGKALKQNNPLEKFFGGGLSPRFKRRAESAGSGFVVSDEGLIITNNHVIKDAEEITINFKDDKVDYEAEIVGVDSKTDLALLKVLNPPKLTPSIFGDSDSLRPGDWVLAVGNPFQLGHTATLGIVSGLSRRLPGSKSNYDDYIQTDAPINQGNSGGPLFNARGEVVGINTAIVSGSGGNIGIGFAIPINQVKQIIKQLYSKGSVTRGWLGVYIQDVDPIVAEALGLDTDVTGSLVAEVITGSPAEKAGIKREDVILEFDGEKIEDNNRLPFIVANTPVGKEVDVLINRNGKQMTIKLTIAELKEDSVKLASSQKSLVPDMEQSYDVLGMTILDLDAEIASALGLDTDGGVVVAEVEEFSLAMEAGIRPGDIIQSVARVEFSNAKELADAIAALPEDQPLLFLIKRGNRTVYRPIKRK